MVRSALIFCLLLCAGCSGLIMIDARSVGVPCGEATCAASETCVAGACVPLSTTGCADGCPAGQQCREGQCLPEGISCTAGAACEPCGPGHPSDGACATGATCVDGICYAGGDAPDACAPGVAGWCPEEDETCESGACVAITTPCSDQSPTGQCPGAQRCVAGRCYADLVDCSLTEPDGWCPTGESCNGGSCAVDPGSCSQAQPTGTCPDWHLCVSGKCVGPVPPDACSVALPRGRCPTDETCVRGTCTPLGDGNACSPSNPTGLCAGDAACDGGLCTKIDADNRCSVTNPGGLCAGGAVCRKGTCEQQPCGSGGYDCDPGSWCDGGACVPLLCDPVHPSGTCADSIQTCTSGVCVDPDCSLAFPNGVCPFGQVCRGGACGDPDCSSAAPSGWCPTDEICDGMSCVPCDFDTTGQCILPCQNDRCGTAQDCCPDVSPECVAGIVCQARCLADRCGPSLVCCPNATPECVADAACLPHCPNTADERCGQIGALCCDSNAGLVCGASTHCVVDCPGGVSLCGDSSTDPGFCCQPGEVCVFDTCVMPTTPCTSFLDCGLGEYCELALQPPRCMPDDYPAGTPSCQGAATNLFAPEVDWHYLGVINIAGTWKLCEEVGDYSSSCYSNVETAPMVLDMDRVVSATDLVWQGRWAATPTTFPAGKTYPEVVLKSYRSGQFSSNVIVVLDGRDGSLKRVVSGETRGHIAIANLDGDAILEIVAAHNGGVYAYDPFYVPSAGPIGATVCPALDDDGNCEISWSNTNPPLDTNFNLGAPAVTDLDGDGQAEVIMGSMALAGQTGAFLISPATTCAYTSGGDPQIASLMNQGTTGEGPISSVADVDLDGVPEVLAGNKAIEISESGGAWSCVLDWDTGGDPSANAFTAVANFVDNTAPPYDAIADPMLPNDQDYAEVAVVYGGKIAILHGKTGAIMPSPVDGTTPLRFDLFTQRGGSPNVADFDGDGHVEVSFAGPGCMTVVDPDCAVVDAAARDALANDPTSGCTVARTSVTACTVDVRAGIGDMLGILWMDETQDQSSSATGTTVFDFQGDGKAEVLYNDECFFRVYDGESGAVLIERPNSHRTGTEYPIVADVDGDSNSEILIASTGDMAVGRDCCAGTTNCATSDRAAYPGAKAYYRSPADLYVLAMYDPAFCTCGNITAQADCDVESGCSWNSGASACEVHDCTQWNNQTECDAAARHCQWVSGNCDPWPDTPDQICRRGTWGVWAFGDKQDLWVKTRPQWHQHTYHVTGADLDGNILADWGAGNNNWEVFNNYRQNVQGFAPLNAPDLIVFSLTANLLSCPRSVTLNARVVNRGRAGIAAGVPLAFYLDVGGVPQLLAEVPLPYALLPGQGADVAFTYTIPIGTATMDFAVIANPPTGAAPAFECRDDNNEAALLGIECPTIGG